MLGFSNMDATEQPAIAFQDPYSDTIVMGAINVKTGKTIEEPAVTHPVKQASRRRGWMWWIVAGVATYFVLR